jgi:hypothetical protein
VIVRARVVVAVERVVLVVVEQQVLLPSASDLKDF